MTHRQVSEPEAVSPRATQYSRALLLNPCMVFPTRPRVWTWPRVTSYIDTVVQRHTHGKFKNTRITVLMTK